MVDELLLNFWREISEFIYVSHVQLQNCHGYLPYVSVPDGFGVKA